MKKEEAERGCVVTVGTFDGVHRGHQEVLRELKEAARQRDLRPVVVTFDRHPLEIVAPERAPLLLQSREERDALLRSFGVEVKEVSFTSSLSSLTAGEWMEELRNRFKAEILISGYDNKFGRDGHSLSPDDYVALGKEKGIEVVVARELPGVCSSLIRRALQDGDVERAAEMLGRDYSVKGDVVEGRHLGRTIGFPTANLDVSARRQLPATGVYSARVEGRPAVVNVGHNPTVDSGNPITVEAHVLEFSGNLYGRIVELEFLRRIRDEKRFGSLEELKTQIAKDVEFCLATEGLPCRLPCHRRRQTLETNRDD